MAKSFRFTGEAADRLSLITRACGLKKDSDAIRLALANLEEHLRVVSQGGSIVLRDADGTEHLWHPTMKPHIMG